MDNDNPDICSICLNTNNNNNNFAITPCGHKFCFNCIIQSLQTIYTCPYCRTILLEIENEEPELNHILTLKEKIILYLKRLYDEGPTNKELLIITLTLISYQSYYIFNLGSTIKNSILMSHCYFIDYEVYI